LYTTTGYVQTPTAIQQPGHSIKYLLITFRWWWLWKCSRDQACTPTCWYKWQPTVNDNQANHFILEQPNSVAMGLDTRYHRRRLYTHYNQTFNPHVVPNKIDDYIYANLALGAQGYRFRVNANNCSTIDRVLRYSNHAGNYQITRSFMWPMLK
jgi:hypothetical protein